MFDFHTSIEDDIESRAGRNPGGFVVANAKLHPTVKVVMVVMHPDMAALRSLAEDVVAGQLVIPIDRMVPLAEAAQAQTAAEKGGVGKILLLA